MKTKLSQEAHDAILGTLVADAAGMGVHWIYSQGKIASIAKNSGSKSSGDKSAGSVSFIEPNPENYQGVPAFFAHPHKKAGEGTNYSEYYYVLLKALGDQGFSLGDFIRIFGEHFGVGGTYVGYADSPMRETIYAMTKQSKELERVCIEIDSSLDSAKKKGASHYIARYFFEFDTPGLKETVRAPLKLQQFSQEELQEVDRIIDRVSQKIPPLGPDDDQMPALTRSALFADLYSGDELKHKLHQAVQVTNNNPKALDYSLYFAHILSDLYEKRRELLAGTKTAENSLDSTLEKTTVEHLAKEFARSATKWASLLSQDSAELVKQALGSQNLDYRAMTKHFGAACHVDMAVPLSIHILVHTNNFQEAVETNNLASGDNCGRAVFLGAIAGVLYGTGGEFGIPLDWIKKTQLDRYDLR
jgi:ADP-ribosylglycohydrolase